MTSIIRFNYLYRDGSNFKSWGELLFSNPDKLDIENISKRLHAAFEQEAFFIAHQIQVPEMFLYNEGNINNADHCFHEFHSVEKIESSNNETHELTILQFIELIEKVSASGWHAFDPLDELPYIQQRLAQLVSKNTHCTR
jgi:hypothetical protein